MGRERIKNLVTSGEGSSARPWPSMDFEVDSMSSRKNTSVKCSSCGARLVVPPQAQTICCAACRATTNVGRSRDPVRQAVGIVKAVVLNICSSISSLSSSSWSSGSSSYGYPTMGQPSSFPRVRGKKRAVLVGISYAGRQYELKGTVNDVNCMRYMLTEKFGFPAECILVLTEGERDPNRVPTKENLRAAMRWLVSGCVAGDSLVFHFSGHGVQRLDSSGDEMDGFDEALCPLDFESNGTIMDDEINDTLVRPLRRGVKLHALVDACHSGTILDLPYLCRLSRAGYYQWENHTAPSGVYKGTNGGLAILISGCDDHQTSADTSAFAGSASTGAMTYSFIQAIESEPGTTYGRLLTAMRAAIRASGIGISINGPIASLMRKVFNFGSTQVPQLSSSEMFDIYRKPFLLNTSAHEVLRGGVQQLDF
ncbi:metacaspase-1-like isoform X2 [Musa acuminata AAA Group]|uniref:metacaspase-1-like isoform X2 n=1 Tax=Musa acuminata AAA Group TaxID=214697 RepID=UPI0031CDC303